MENDNNNDRLAKRPSAPKPIRGQVQTRIMLEERLEEHNGRISMLEQTMALVLDEILNPGIDPMNRARLLARLGALTVEE